MSLRQRYLKVLSAVLPAGAAGLSLLLGSTTPASAEREGAAADRALVEASVSSRLAAIRDAVSAVAGSQAKVEPQLAWWANGGWRNGGGGWRNGGWGWHNGGWHNGWHNYWRNW
jgi:rSAM-associated Gly-rich repeat protein